jgi:hypothetical protein
MSTSIVKPDVEKIQNQLSVLTGRVDSIEKITTADQYRDMADNVTAVRVYMKSVGFELDPGIAKAKETYDHLKNQKAKYIQPAQTIEETARAKMAAYNERERLAAEAETRRINEERRVQAQREADEAKRKAEAEAEEKRKEAEAWAAAEKKANEAKAEADRKAKEKEIKDAQKSGEITKREAEKAARKAELEAEERKKKAAADHQRALQEACDEERRHNEQAKREADAAAANVQEVKVEPNRVAVAGIRGGGSWQWEMKQIAMVPRELLYPNDVSDVENFPRITKMVKESKNKELAEKLAGGGIRVFFKDR